MTSPQVVTAATVLPGADGAPVGLRRARRLRRDRRRRRIRLAALAVIVLAAALGAGLTIPRSHHPLPPTPVAGRGQHTLLLGIGAAGGSAQSVALLAVDPAARTGGTLLIPPDTLVDGPGGTVGGSAPVSPPGEFAGAVSDLLGVRVDATWRLTPAGLAALVDRVGGITVDVDTAVTTPTVTLAAGTQPLTGAQAAAYALDRADTEQAQANRTRLVLDALLPRLAAASDAATALGGLGPASATTLPPAGLATLLTQLVASNDGEHEELLPTTTLDAGGTAPSFAVDRTAAAPIVASLFGGSRLAADGAAGTRVEVVNDSGRPNLATGARTQLSGAGLSFVRAVNDRPFHQYRQSSILVFDSSAASIAFGHRVATALGLPAAPVLVSAQTTSVADALAVLAGDYPG